jgi:hypothetical protein
MPSVHYVDDLPAEDRVKALRTLGLIRKTVLANEARQVPIIPIRPYTARTLKFVNAARAAGLRWRTQLNTTQKAAYKTYAATSTVDRLSLKLAHNHGYRLFASYDLADEYHNLPEDPARLPTSTWTPLYTWLQQALATPQILEWFVRWPETTADIGETTACCYQIRPSRCQKAGAHRTTRLVDILCLPDIMPDIFEYRREVAPAWPLVKGKVAGIIVSITNLYRWKWFGPYYVMAD